MATMRERFSEFMRRHIVDFDPCEVPELSGESITDEDRKEASRVLTKLENHDAWLSATRGGVSIVEHGHPSAIESMARSLRAHGYDVMVR